MVYFFNFERNWPFCFLEMDGMEAFGETQKLGFVYFFSQVMMEEKLQEPRKFQSEEEEEEEVRFIRRELRLVRRKTVKLVGKWYCYRILWKSYWKCVRKRWVSFQLKYLREKEPKLTTSLLSEMVIFSFLQEILDSHATKVLRREGANSLSFLFYLTPKRNLILCIDTISYINIKCIDNAYILEQI